MGFSVKGLVQGAATGGMTGNPWGAVIGAGIGAFGDQLSANSAAVKNKREAQRQRDWQSYMSDTAHQREVADLEASGLNPILTATGGNGASTGSSGLATAVATGGFGNGISNAVKGYKADTERKVAEAQQDTLVSQAEKNLADADLARVSAQNSAALLPEQIATQRAQRGMYDAQALYSRNNAILSALNLPQAEAQAQMWQTKYGQVLPFVNSAIGVVGDAVGTFRKVRPAVYETDISHYGNNGVVNGGTYIHRSY